MKPLLITPLGLAVLLIITAFLSFMFGMLFEMIRESNRDFEQMDEADEREWRKENYNKPVQP